MSSWTEQYEQRKRERLAQEAALKNKNVGFAAPGNQSSTTTVKIELKSPYNSSKDLTNICDSSPIEIKQESQQCTYSNSSLNRELDETTFNSIEIKPESLECTYSNSSLNRIIDETTLNSAKIGEETEKFSVAKPAAKRPLFPGAGGPAAKRPSQTKDPNDPWFAAYEAKRQEALNNMKQGNLQSVVGASAYCGKINGVLQYSAQNQVTRLMKKLKKDEKFPKVVFLDRESEETAPVIGRASSQTKQLTVSTRSAGITTVEPFNTPDSDSQKTTTSRMPVNIFSDNEPSNRLPTHSNQSAGRPSAETVKAPGSDSQITKVTATPVNHCSESQPSKRFPAPSYQLAKRTSAAPVKTPGSDSQITKPAAATKVNNCSGNQPSNRLPTPSFYSGSNTGQAKRFVRPPLPPSELATVDAMNQMGRDLEAHDVRAPQPVRGRSIGASGIRPAPANLSSFRLGTPPPVSDNGARFMTKTGNFNAFHGKSSTVVSRFSPQNGGFQSKSVSSGVSSGAFNRKPPPPPSVLAAAYHQGAAVASAALSTENAVRPGIRELSGTPHNRFYPYSPSQRPTGPLSSNSTRFSSPDDRPDRPSVPTPRRYGTQYGGAPSPGPQPSQAFKPPGFMPPTPPTSSNLPERDVKFNQILRYAKADSKKTSDSWQQEYEARKMSRLQQKF